MAREKEYTGTIVLGASTPTFDLESEPVTGTDPIGISKEQLVVATVGFKGDILQIPPIHSAIKVNGKRVYELARKGHDIKLEPRPVHITTFEITEVNMPEVGFRVICSTGTYIRSLANDYGKTLGCGGYLSSLRRTRIGEFSVQDAWNMEQAELQIRTTLNHQNG
jgi:tRNA pseudouridine55 synthase